MPGFDLNKSLWKDEKLFEQYHWGALAFSKAYNDELKDPEIFLKLANHLDDIMQKYEERYNSINDPLFYWVFSTSNALYLLTGGTEDVAVRIQYILNGYKEGLSKHTRYPSYTSNLINLAFEFMKPFSDEQIDKWIEGNKNDFIPIPK